MFVEVDSARAPGRLLASGPLPTAHGAFTTYGNVDPSYPATWTSSTTGYVGKSSNGTLTVDSGSDLYSSYGYIGYYTGVTGVVTISGTGSTWTCANGLNVGEQGNGTLNITGGGAVSVNGYSDYVGFLTGSKGVVNVDGAG